MSSLFDDFSSALELRELLGHISSRAHPEFLKEIGPLIFSKALPGEKPIGFQSTKIKLNRLLSEEAPTEALGESLGEFLVLKMMRFFLSDRLLFAIQLVNARNMKTLHELSEAEGIKILALAKALNLAPVIWDDSACSREIYPVKLGYWKGLQGYWSGVRHFYKALHQCLIYQLIQETVRKDLNNMVIWDLGCGTGKLITMLLKEISSRSSPLCGRVIKVVGIDLSKENIKLFHQSCVDLKNKLNSSDKKSHQAKALSLGRIAIEGYPIGVDQIDRIDRLVISPGETLIALTSGGLTRHVMPFSVAHRAFEILREKGAEIFIGGGLEPVWMNSRIAKQLGFSYDTTEKLDLGEEAATEFGEKRLIILEKKAGIPVAEKPCVFGAFAEEDRGSEESGYFEKAFSNAFLFRASGEGDGRVSEDGSLGPESLRSSVSVSPSSRT